MPDATPSRTLKSVREGDHLSIEYYAAQMFDVGKLQDMPTVGTYETLESTADPLRRGYFVYPEDAYLKYQSPANPATQIPTIALGRSTFYLVANNAYRLHFNYLPASAVPTDAATYQAFYQKAMRHCYLTKNEDTFGGSARASDDEYQIVAGRTGVNAEQNPVKKKNVLAFHNVLVGPPPHPDELYLEIEAVVTETPSEAEAGQICDDTSRTKVGTFPSPVDHPAAVVLVKLQQPSDVGPPEVRYHIANKETTTRMDSLGAERGAYVFDTPTLTAGHFDYQICFQTNVAQGAPPPTTSASDHCLPAQPVSFNVNSAYPSPFRLQPGLIAVNRFRDVRLTAHMVFILNRRNYFGSRPFFNPIGGLLNPTVGLQLGGSTNQIVLLAGLHVRVINEAGIVGGFRFGNDAPGTPWRITQNYYFGFSLDPALMTSLRGQSGS